MQFKRASPSMFQEMVEEDSMKQRDSDEVDFMANQVFLTLFLHFVKIRKIMFINPRQ